MVATGNSYRNNSFDLLLRGHVGGDLGRISTGQAKNFHTLLVTLLVVSESCDQANHSKRDIPPKTNTHHGITHPLRIFPVGPRHPNPSSLVSLIERGLGSLSSTSEEPGGTESARRANSVWVADPECAAFPFSDER